ncbi:hypothetical protein [Lacihabitans lacunae]|uniref:Uncharacterized protein n=1 Tax=Lacihabitans lacunae TaxID=1028214 RepID=A0ABV7Z0E8_9BACT
MENKNLKYLKVYEIGPLYSMNPFESIYDSIKKANVLNNDNIRHLIGDITSKIASNFIVLFYEKVKFPNTDWLSVSFVDIDNLSQEKINEIEHDFIKLGYKIGQYMGSTRLLISITKLYSLDSENERYIYLLTCIYNSILVFCEKFQIETTEISNAYNFMCTSDFYLPIILKSYQNKKKTYVARIQSKSGFYYDSYRLALLKIEGLEKTYYKDMQNNRDNFNIEYFEIGQKENSAVLLNRIDFKQYEPFKTGGGEVPPFCFTDEKWINNDVFSFQWGEEEKYEFNLKEMKLRKI